MDLNIDHSLEITNVKEELTDSTSTDNNLEIENIEVKPIEMKTILVTQKSDDLFEPEIPIKTEVEEESEFPSIASTSYELCPQYENVIETEPMMKIECVYMVEEPMKDPLDIGNEVKEAEAKGDRKKRRGPNKDWTLVEEFKTVSEAENYVKSQEIWRKTASRKCSEGFKVEYRCTKGKYRKKECPAGLSLLYHADNEGVALLTTGEHENHVEGALRGLEEDIKIFIEEKYKLGIVKPKPILRLLKKQNFTEPPKNKIICFLKTLRMKYPRQRKAQKNNL